MPYVVTTDDDLLRRVLPVHVVRDVGRVSSAAFKDSRKKPRFDASVYIEAIASAEEAHSHGPSYLGVARLSARVPLQAGLGVEADPLPDAPRHALITGTSTKGHCAVLADACTIVIHPSYR